MKEKVVLAYSGGLDTTAVIPWLKENYDYDVVCCCVNVYHLFYDVAQIQCLFL